MKNAKFLPALKSRVGDWVFYTCSMTFDDVFNLIKSPDEIHESKKLSGWIQREAIQKHSENIAQYIIETEQRFLGAIIVGVYDGDPHWSPIEVNYNTPDLDVSEGKREELSGHLGVLSFSGQEKLFAIDGQHRVEGIKKALKNSGEQDLSSEHICAIFVGHDESSKKGKLRTRRLFTTLNKKAKPVSKSATIALDEDNGFAIVTRLLVDEFPLFADEKEIILFSSSSALDKKSSICFTSIVGLYETVKDLYPTSGKNAFGAGRPSHDLIEEHFARCKIYFESLLVKCKELNSVFLKREKDPYDYRNEKVNHLLFRTAGQRAFARAVKVLNGRGDSVENAVKKLLKANLDLTEANWAYILWNPVAKKMIPSNIPMAENLLLNMIGEEVSNHKNFNKINIIRESIKN